MQGGARWCSGTPPSEIAAPHWHFAMPSSLVRLPSPPLREPLRFGHSHFSATPIASKSRDFAPSFTLSLRSPIISLPFPTTLSPFGHSIWKCGPPRVATTLIWLPIRSCRHPRQYYIIIFLVCPGLGPQRSREGLISPAGCTQWRLLRRYEPPVELGLEWWEKE